MNRFFTALGKLVVTVALIFAMIISLEIAKHFIGQMANLVSFIAAMVLMFYLYYSESK